MQEKPQKKRGRGQPTKRTPENAKLILDAVRLGLTEDTARQLVPLSDSALTSWKSEDPDFLASLTRARADGKYRNSNRLDARIEAGDTKALTFWLERRCPEFQQEKEEKPKTVAEQAADMVAMYHAMRTLDGVDDSGSS